MDHSLVLLFYLTVCCYQFLLELFSFTKHPISRVALAGSTIVFTCSVTGHPSPTITWKRNSIPVSGLRYDTAGGKLTIFHVNKEAAGNFSCDGHQLGYKTEESARAVLTVICMYVS